MRPRIPLDSTSSARPVSEDALLDGRLRLCQPAAGYRAAIDPVFLAAAVPGEAGSRVLDLGCGVGAAALCLLTRVPRARRILADAGEPLGE